MAEGAESDTRQIEIVQRTEGEFKMRGYVGVFHFGGPRFGYVWPNIGEIDRIERYVLPFVWKVVAVVEC